MKYRYLITFLLLIGCSASSYKNTDLHGLDSFSKGTLIKDVVDADPNENVMIDQDVTPEGYNEYEGDMDVFIHDIRESQEIYDMSGDQ